MSYESRMIVVDRYEFDNGHVWGEEIFRFNLCAMGYDLVNGKSFCDIFDTDIDFDVYGRSCELDRDEDKDAYRKDCYGKICGMTTIDKVIEWLEKADMDYRRAKSFLAALKGFKESESDYGDIRVVHFGY